MTYSQIIQVIESIYFQIDQKWMKECLEIARKENLAFLTMQVFLDWACCEGEDEEEEAPEVLDKWEAEDRAALMAAMEEEE